MDTLSVKERSARMALIKSKNTGPELAVRRLVFSMGFRYRLHSANLPGHPDMVFKARKKIIFVHGCFWHGHKCSLGRMPKSKIGFWRNKIESNRHRDRKVVRCLRNMGWKILTIWECRLRNEQRLTNSISRFLSKQNV